MIKLSEYKAIGYVGFVIALATLFVKECSEGLSFALPDLSTNLIIVILIAIYVLWLILAYTEKNKNVLLGLTVLLLLISILNFLFLSLCAEGQTFDLMTKIAFFIGNALMFASVYFGRKK
jgi:hypothetical protein